MDDTLRDIALYYNHNFPEVLILVLMDDTLREGINVLPKDNYVRS